MNRGTFVVFEGLDGSGKTTQLERLARHLETRGADVVRTREPYDCPAGRRIRAMARSDEPPDPLQELAWFQEQRREHVREVIAPALAAGRIVLCDRYFLSTVAYQGARGLDADRILRESEAELPLPDLVLLLDLPPDEGLRRVAARGGPLEPAFEEADFLARVAAAFGAIERPYVVRIDARGGPEEVGERIQKALAGRLPELGLG